MTNEHAKGATKMRKEMRIVGLNQNNIFVQKKYAGEWKQSIMNMAEFENMMQTEYPTYWEIYKYYGKPERKTAADWFYNFGEDYEMKRKGEAFIYR